MLHLEQRYSTSTGLEDNVLVGVSETGYSNNELSLGWLRHFERFSARKQLGTYRLHLLNGYGSHCTKESIEFCDDHKIILFCLPPHNSSPAVGRGSFPAL